MMLYLFLQILLYLFMGHSIVAVILKGKCSIEEMNEYDLRPIILKQNLTMFFINSYYSEYWQRTKLKERSHLDIDTSLYPFDFPTDKVIAIIMREISLDNALFSIIYTEYFGGVGEQFACIFEGDFNQKKTIVTINEALCILGVERESELDEFDTLGLYIYRSQPAYLDKYSDLLEELDC